jgi:hypothetical protein
MRACAGGHQVDRGAIRSLEQHLHVQWHLLRSRAMGALTEPVESTQRPPSLPQFSLCELVLVVLVVEVGAGAVGGEESQRVVEEIKLSFVCHRSCC